MSAAVGLTLFIHNTWKLRSFRLETVNVPLYHNDSLRAERNKRKNERNKLDTFYRYHFRASKKNKQIPKFRVNNKLELCDISVSHNSGATMKMCSRKTEGSDERNLNITGLHRRFCGSGVATIHELNHRRSRNLR